MERGLPSAARLAVLKGSALLSEGRREDAITELERALELGLKDPTIHVLLGVVQHQLGDTTGAWAQYEAAMAEAQAFLRRYWPGAIW